MVMSGVTLSRYEWKHSISAHPGAGMWLGPVKVPVNGRSGGAGGAAVRTRIDGPDLIKVLQ